MAILSTRYSPSYITACLAVIILLVLFAELPDSTLFWSELQNTGHTFLFAIVAVLVLQLLQAAAVFSRKRQLKLYVSAFLLSLFIGVTTEVMQLMMNSDASGIDVLRDIAGITTGLGLYWGFDIKNNQYELKYQSMIGLGVMASSICVFMASMYPLAHLSLAYIQREQAFPLVVDLTASWSGPFVSYKRATLMQGESRSFKGGAENSLVRIDFEAAVYPGFSMIEPHADWSPYKELILTVYSTNTKPTNLVLRVHDERHNNDFIDRFNRRLQIHMGENVFHIPLRDIREAPENREMDMTRIRNISIFIDHLTTPLSLYLDQIKLE